MLAPSFSELRPLQKMLLLAVPVFFIGIGILILRLPTEHRLSGLRPIEMSELSTSTLPVTHQECFKPRPELAERCTKAGGTLQNFVMNGAAFNPERYGCYPSGETTDAHKPCTSDAMCEGRCIWQGTDFIAPGSTNTCSAFKKPFFRTAEEITDYIWCDDKRTWPIDENISST